MPKVYIKTFGCAMNVRDSEAVAGLFKVKGFALTEDIKAADIILVNTCSVREHAEERAISFLGTLKKLQITNDKLQIESRRKSSKICNLQSAICNSGRIIGLIGCMAKRRGEEVMKRMPHINLVLGPANMDKIVEYVKIILENKITNDKLVRKPLRRGQIANCKRIIDIEDKARDESFYEASYRIEPQAAQVVISTGCSNYCTYCVVPSARGRLRPRNPEDIIREVEKNIKLGIKKITLLGQNVNDYNFVVGAGSPRPNCVTFVDLLKMAADVEGIEEVSFVTSHPKNTSKELFELMAKHPKIKKQLHLPFQSGSDKILKAMNRGYSRAQYLKLALDYKKITKGSIGTDIIIGFPGETVDDYKLTRDLIEQIKFNYAYIFTYSPRPNTAAQKLTDDVPLEEKKRRHAELLAMQKEISSKK